MDENLCPNAQDRVDKNMEVQCSTVVLSFFSYLKVVVVLFFETCCELNISSIIFKF